MKELGPQGAAVAAMIEGSQLITVSLTTAFEKINEATAGSRGLIADFGIEIGSVWENMLPEEKFDVAIAAVGALGNAIGGLGQLMAAASQQRVAGIDAEIKAEQKRDGKSAQSVAKIKALEKKKEAVKRKAFEQNKKMMMAEVIMATAVAIMNSIKMGMPWGLVFGAMAAAIGVAQLAVISGMTYQGGGGNVASVPSSASVGKRTSSVDLARSQSASGELAYMRGAKGQGGPENFERAFYGKKHRAAGGNAGYIVGEQGPELFMPDRPGTVVPNDDIDAVAGGSNVTFNINAIDAAGIEDVLTEQQGNIIGMIRSAANEYGDPFLENIDTSIYSTPFAGYRRA
jgi:hypothetical protein